MEGVIDAATRDLLTRSAGIDWTVTEFVRVVDTRLPPRVFLRHCPELASGDPRTPSGIPVHLQLLGSDPAALAANARQALSLGATSLDLNFGCPAKLVNRHDGGASMLRDPHRLRTAVAAVHGAVGDTLPVTAKIRLGFADRRLALDCAVPPRTAARANWWSTPVPATRLSPPGALGVDRTHPPAPVDPRGGKRRHLDPRGLLEGPNPLGMLRCHARPRRSGRPRPGAPHPPLAGHRGTASLHRLAHQGGDAARLCCNAA